jgi:hypothetical protein
MSVTRSVFASAVSSVFVLALLAGCKKAETPPTPSMGDSPSTSGSVAAPPSSMPPSEAATPPSPATGTTDSGDAAGATQAHPKDLTKEEESSTMPQSGQVNNHSTANPVSGEQK